MFSLWVETLALVPQVWLSKQEGIINWATAAFVFLAMLSRIFQAIFWFQFASMPVVHVDKWAFGLPILLNAAIIVFFLGSFLNHFRILILSSN